MKGMVMMPALRGNLLFEKENEMFEIYLKARNWQALES